MLLLVPCFFFFLNKIPLGVRVFGGLGRLKSKASLVGKILGAKMNKWHKIHIENVGIEITSENR